MSDTEICKMKVADLKRELKNRHLSTVGNKIELQERLQAAYLVGDSTLDDTVISEGFLEDDVLNDDELDEDAKSLGLLDVHEDAVLKSPQSEIDTKSQNGEDICAQKKVILKRNISLITTNTDTSVINKSDDILSSADSKTSDHSDSEPDKKVVKLSDLSIKARLEMRAKKFGGNIPPDVKKQARAERFGLAKNNENDDKSISKNEPIVTVEALKKRAERFGVSVSSTMTKIENQEKLLKRQERFGVKNTTNSATVNTATTDSSNTGTTTVTTAVPTDYAEKAKKRLERFKPTVK